MARRRKRGIPGVSFSWKRAVGISAAKGRISRKIRLPTHKIRPSKKNGTCSRVYGSYYHCPERSIGCHPLSFFIGFAGYRDAGVSPLKYLKHKEKDISGWGTEVRDKAEMQCLIVTTNRDDPNKSDHYAIKVGLIDFSHSSSLTCADAHLERLRRGRRRGATSPISDNHQSWYIRTGCRLFASPDPSHPAKTVAAMYPACRMWWLPDGKAHRELRHCRCHRRRLCACGELRGRGFLCSGPFFFPYLLTMQARIGVSG